MADNLFRRKRTKPAKKFNGLNRPGQQEQSYLQTRITALLPNLMQKVTQNQDGVFAFTHPTFPDLKVEGMTIGFVEEHVERAIKRQFRGQSNKHVDYLFDLLSK